MVTKIENISHLTKLHNLWLKRNKIGSNGIEDYEELAKMKDLHVLDLRDNCIRDGAELLSVLK